MSDVTGTTDYAYQGDRATTLTGALPASISYDHAGRATSRVAAGLEAEGFVHDTLDRLTQVRRNGVVTEILEYAPTGEPVFRKLGTHGTWSVGAVGTVTGTVAAGCTGIDTVLIPLASRCTPVAGTVKVAAHVQVAGGRVASIKAAAGAGLDPVSEVLYYHRDMQGSVVATTYRTAGLSGAMGARFRYTPYGQLDRAENVTTLSDSELGYTGGLRLGYAAGAAQQGSLVLLGARVYHAELKRWLVPDTVDGRRYTYVGGDPVNFVDPSGRMAIEGGGGGGGATGVGSLSGSGAYARSPLNTMAVDDTLPCRIVGTDPDGTTVLVCGGGGGGQPASPGNYRPPPGNPPPERGEGGGGGGAGGGASKTAKPFRAITDSKAMKVFTLTTGIAAATWGLASSITALSVGQISVIGIVLTVGTSPLALIGGVLAIGLVTVVGIAIAIDAGVDIANGNYYGGRGYSPRRRRRPRAVASSPLTAVISNWVKRLVGACRCTPAFIPARNGT